MPYTDKTPKQIKLDEKNHVEEPFLKQLEGLGWTVIRLEQKQQPKESFRENFTDVVLLPKLRKALQQINPWLEDDQVEDVIRRITGFSGSNLLANNQAVLKFLLENMTVSDTINLLSPPAANTPNSAPSAPISKNTSIAGLIPILVA